MRKNHKSNTAISLANRLQSLDTQVAGKLAIRKQNNKSILQQLLQCELDLQNLAASLVAAQSSWSITSIFIDGYIYEITDGYNNLVLDGYPPSLSFLVNINPAVSAGTQFNGTTINSCEFLIKAGSEHAIVINCSVSSAEVKLMNSNKSFANALALYISNTLTANLTVMQ